MPKYLIPIIANSVTEIEAENLEEAIAQVNNGDPDIPGIDKEKVSNWEIDQWASVSKDDKVLMDEANEVELYLSDIPNPSEY